MAKVKDIQLCVLFLYSIQRWGIVCFRQGNSLCFLNFYCALSLAISGIAFAVLTARSLAGTLAIER